MADPFSSSVTRRQAVKPSSDTCNISKTPVMTNSDAERISMLPNEKKSSDSDKDRISILPKNVIESILMCLPIRDAVRTSILSRGWRYEWSSLPQLVIDELSFPCPKDLAHLEFGKKIVKAVDHILLLHCGPISKFKLLIEFESCANIERWILFLSRNGIKELILSVFDGEIYNLPSCLFSCADLAYLFLYNCSFIPPTSFKGFNWLTSLALWSVTVDGNGLEILLSRCPLLKKLTLIDIAGCSNLKVSAQELVDLTIRSAFEDLHFKGTPLLAGAFISLDSPDNSFVANRQGCRIVDVFGQMPSIRRLGLFNCTLQHWSVGDVPVRLPVICPVKHLLIHINLEDMQEMLAAFCIFRSSLVMEKLDIQAISNKNIARISVDGFWEGEGNFDCTFSHLQAVEVTEFTGITSELKFIEFILANAPVLETLHIKFKKNVRCVLEIFRKLVRFPRSSPKAEVIVPA